mmetsp:Transcript_37563/g.88860  ORF Transcript_37563/g.88860 Transcript_37563/m.88860 type:complete len:296 (-) Transcript_37563:752-1639(-)
MIRSLSASWLSRTTSPPPWSCRREDSSVISWSRWCTAVRSSWRSRWSCCCLKSDAPLFFSGASASVACICSLSSAMSASFCCIWIRFCFSSEMISSMWNRSSRTPSTSSSISCCRRSSSSMTSCACRSFSCSWVASTILSSRTWMCCRCSSASCDTSSSWPLCSVRRWSFSVLDVSCLRRSWCTLSRSVFLPRTASCIPARSARRSPISSSLAFASIVSTAIFSCIIRMVAMCSRRVCRRVSSDCPSAISSTSEGAIGCPRARSSSRSSAAIFLFASPRCSISAPSMALSHSSLA